VVDLDSGRFVKYLPDLGMPARIVMSPDGTRLYMQDVDVKGIRVVSLPDGAEVARLDWQVGGNGDLMLSPDGGLLVASCYYGLRYVDTRTWAVVCSLPCGVLASVAARPQFDTLYAVEHARTFVIGRKQ
jgi:sugar lactone lactonase YvrE